MGSPGRVESVVKDRKRIGGIGDEMLEIWGYAFHN